MRLRLLPVLVLTASLALTVRVGDLWQGVDGMARAQTAEKVAEKTAQQAAADAKDAAAKDRATTEKAARKPAQAAPPATKAAAPKASRPGADPGDTPAPMQVARTQDLPSDPLLMTDEEVDLLQALANRRRVLDERDRELGDREALLEAAQRRIEEKVTGLEALKKSIESLLVQQQDETETQYKSLVKIYENMKPKDAARIFEELEMAVLIPVVERMKERKTAPILAKMNPMKAKAITVELAQRRNPPEDGQKAEQK